MKRDCRLKANHNMISSTALNAAADMVPSTAASDSLVLPSNHQLVDSGIVLMFIVDLHTRARDSGQGPSLPVSAKHTNQVVKVPSGHIGHHHPEQGIHLNGPFINGLRSDSGADRGSSSSQG